MKGWIQLIKELIQAKFYGELILKFYDGKIVLCQKMESIKLDS